MSTFTLQRRWYSDRDTQGFFTFGTSRAYSLEDRVRDPVVKVPGATAIPSGTYKVIISRSNRFSARASIKVGHPVDVFLPEILEVPRFTGIRIHGGNSDADTEGCPIIARFRDPLQRNPVWGCAKPLAELIVWIKAQDECFITITDEPETDTRTIPAAGGPQPDTNQA